MKRVKRLVIYLVVLFLVLSSPIKTSISRPANRQLVFLIYNSREVYGSTVFSNIVDTLSKSGIETISWDLSKQKYIPDLSYYPIVGMVTEDLTELDSETAKNIKEYIRKSGNYIQFIRGYSEYLAEVFSIDQKYTPTKAMLRGLRFSSEFIPGATEINLDDSYFTDDSFTYSFLGSIRPLAMSGNGIPILWETGFGSGKTLFWNTSVLANKAFRGFIVASVTRYLEVSARRVIGKSVMFVDDFPSSSWRAKLEPTYSELGVTDTGFYSQILLNDLVTLAKEYSLRYSTVAVFNYNNVIKPPFTFADWDNCNVLENGKTVNVPGKILNTLLSKPEIFDVGLHGYNHIQLTLPMWLQETYMSQGLAEARKKWMSLFPYPPKFYVPPMNEIDITGFSSLKTIFPEIQTVCSVYDAETDLGQNRDFGMDPWDNQVVDIPRCTSGFYFNPYDRMVAYSTMEAYGIWTHFIHPDDIFSNPTNYPNFPVEWIRNKENLPWYGELTGKNGLFYRFKNDLDSMRNNFPWIDYSTVSDTRQTIVNYVLDTEPPIITTQKIVFNNIYKQRYLVDLPNYLSLEPNPNIHVLTTCEFGKKQRMLVEVLEGCSVNFAPN
jgi:hypothetical protein